ncbi:hypothetical protein [uncultured Bradyrhizobium sp.]|jgi:hypothetical protein|uniref:hypothetical protein n=1 Tax=uncultured Bradyrhizobium sp. TaxID=199684 RepID=UPI002609ACF6|nr:hypothetical protein [uncultured Bradyrhizobium sp.]
MTTNFLFMDEKFADQGAPLHARAISLTGILIPADAHKAFRESFYDLVHQAIGDKQNVISPMPVRFLRSIGQPLTPFKSGLAEIASSLEPTIAFDEVIEMKIEMPPAGHRPNGPIRFVCPIVPQDG